MDLKQIKTTLGLKSPPDTPSVHKSHGTKCRGMGGLKTLNFLIFIYYMYFISTTFSIKFYHKLA